MKVNLITNTDSIGLRQDVAIVKRLLESMNPPVDVRVINNFASSIDTFGQGADLSIFLESLHNGDRYLQSARANWLITNPEWYDPKLFDRHLPLISLIVCKTQHAYRVWSNQVGPDRCLYAGFESRDMLVDGIDKVNDFIHVAGKSEAKGTDAIAEAWRGLWGGGVSYPLTVVTRSHTVAEDQVTRRLASLFSACARSIRILHNISDEHLARELSRHRFAVQPSLYEGYGHAIHEAFSAKCAVITTDAPPMNEFPGVCSGLLVPVERRIPRMMVEFNYCFAENLKRAVEAAARMRAIDLEAIGDRARREWEVDRSIFRNTFTGAIRRWEEWI